ncbi:hypothetical protein V6C27_03195 [Peptococcaceae bacterium 1198_IL3148]
MNGKNILLKVFTASHHAVNGIIIPFLPLMFNHRGYSYWQIGLLLAIIFNPLAVAGLYYKY